MAGRLQRMFFILDVALTSRQACYHRISSWLTHTTTDSSDNTATVRRCVDESIRLTTRWNTGISLAATPSQRDTGVVTTQDQTDNSR